MEAASTKASKGKTDRFDPQFRGIGSVRALVPVDGQMPPL